jgi:osmotically-inducible protein OsmY
MHSKLTIAAKTLCICLLWAASGYSAPAQAPDNSANNKDHAVTADQAGNHKSDVELAKSVRRAITSDKQLSVYAHNVKVIVNAGAVTLKGPVHSQEEKDAVVAKAKEAAEGSAVDDQITIKPPKS